MFDVRCCSLFPQLLELVRVHAHVHVVDQIEQLELEYSTGRTAAQLGHQIDYVARSKCRTDSSCTLIIIHHSIIYRAANNEKNIQLPKIGSLL